MDWVIFAVIILSAIEVLVLMRINTKVETANKKQDATIACEHKRAVSDSKIQKHMETAAVNMTQTDAQLAAINRAIERFNNRLSSIENKQ